MFYKVVIMNKKADIVWSKISNIVIILALLFVLLFIMYSQRDKINMLWKKIALMLRFGM